MRLLARAQALEAQGKDIIHMEVGEPDFATPEPIALAAEHALRAGQTHYTPALGIPALREAIADFYQQQFRIDVDPQRVVVTTGGSAALQLAILLLIESGDRLLLSDPGYPCNRHMVTLAGGIPQTVAVRAQTNFQFTAAQVSQAWQTTTRGILLTSPSNPTGSVLSREEMHKIYAVVQHHEGVMLVDEIYQSLVYDEAPMTALGLGEDVFVINSFSKYFGMTGWRLGWMVAPWSCVAALEKLAQNLYLAPPTLAQHAALAAFQPATLEILEARRELFRQRRDFLAEALRTLGFGLDYQPGGAFYLYVDSRHYGPDSDVLAERMLEEIGVAVTPGRDFGTQAAERYLRFAFTTDYARLEAAVERLAQWRS